MTPYVYQQFYLALINDGDLHSIIHRAEDYRGRTGPDSTAHHQGDQSVRHRVRKLCQQFNMREPTEPQLRELVRVVIEDHLSGRQTAIVNEMERDEVPPSTRRADGHQRRVTGTEVRNYLVQSHVAEAMADLQALDECNLFLYDPATGKIEHINPTSKEPTTMSQKITIETRTFLNGSDAKHYSDADLIGRIEQAEAEITRLENVKTKSQKITDRIKELTAGAAQLAELLDARK